MLQNSYCGNIIYFLCQNFNRTTLLIYQTRLYKLQTRIIYFQTRINYIIPPIGAISKERVFFLGFLLFTKPALLPFFSDRTVPFKVHLITCTHTLKAGLSGLSHLYFVFCVLFIIFRFCVFCILYLYFVLFFFVLYFIFCVLYFVLLFCILYFMFYIL